jgi:hypothetical protein
MSLTSLSYSANEEFGVLCPVVKGSGARVTSTQASGGNRTRMLAGTYYDRPMKERHGGLIADLIRSMVPKVINKKFTFRKGAVRICLHMLHAQLNV